MDTLAGSPSAGRERPHVHVLRPNSSIDRPWASASGCRSPGPIGVSVLHPRSPTAVGNFLGFLRLLGALICGMGQICRRWGRLWMEDLPDDEARVEVSGSSFCAGAGAGLDLLCFPGRTPPRGRGDLRRLWFSPRHGRLCYLPPAGEPSPACLNFVPATAVLGVLGILGAVVGTVLALTRGSDLASLMRNFLAEQPNRQCR
jgi:hypothetical protein